MKKKLALTPPMGWNSWDCYGASVTEAEVRGNAEYMAEHMKAYGWEYIVVDIQWYEPDANSSAYRPFVPLEMDAYSRLIPATKRFPSATNGQGFKPLADYIHSLGLKFGIHILRGVPRQAVHTNSQILGTNVKAREIALTDSICQWNTDMYGIDPTKPGAAAYYNSLFELYASWGVDFVKVDDISSAYIGNVPYFAGEIELIRNAIEYCGHEMVLSLSPGPAPIEQAEHLKKHAQMWRMTADYWDCWGDLFEEFEKCHQWSPHVGEGHWPDADMLPLGHLAIRSCEHGIGDRWTRFSQAEQLTMLTLWCIFRSPLMVGCELRDNDDWTLNLLTNEEVLHVLKHSHSGRQLYRDGHSIAWHALSETGDHYLAIFNTGTTPVKIETPLNKIDLPESVQVRDLWSRTDLGETKKSIILDVPIHGARLVKLTKK